MLSAGGVGDAEVEIEREASLVAGVELAQRRAAFEDQRVEAAALVQIAQKEVLGDLDDGGVAHDAVARAPDPVTP